MNRSLISDPPPRCLRAPAKAAAALLSFALLLPAFQAKTPAPEAQPPKGSMEGTVVDARAGTPVKDATLLLARSSGTGTPASAKTDENGHFLFKDLDSGSYVLIGEHPRYARQTYGSRNGLLGGTLLTLSPGQDMKEISFKLLPNGVASGRVLDSDGEPLAKVMVAALKGMYQRGKRQFLPLGTAMTNDLGEFRISNLAAGRYVLSATLMDQGSAAAKPAGDEPETAFVTTYYPNSTEATGAAAIDVTAGGDAGGLDIRLAKARAVRVKGKVVGDLKDQNVTARLVPKGAGLLAALTGRNARVNKADGTFEITGVTTGSYMLRIGDQTGMKVLGAGVPVEVGDKPITGVVAELASHADLPGAVVLEGTDQKPVSGVPLKGARIYLEAVETLNLMPPNATVSEDGTFSLKELAPERYVVRVLNGPPGSYVESVQLGSQKMAEEGLPLGGAGGAKLEIKLRLAGAQVNGVIRGQDDNPMSGVTVALIPDSRRYLLYQSTFTDQNGAFNFKTVTPGDYKVLAWEEIEPNAFMDPEVLKPFEGRAESVSLKENEHKTVTLKAIPRAR